jgi:uncharacterized Fe-S cluster-containing radical SAM superfamily protein
MATMREGRDDELSSLFGKREYAAIRHCVEGSRKDDPYAFVVFGGSHDFRTQLERWNAEHKEEMCALAVVSSASKNKQLRASADYYQSRLDTVIPSDLVELSWWRTTFTHAKELLHEQ